MLVGGGIASLPLRNTKKKAVSRRLFFHGISLFDFLRYKKIELVFKTGAKVLLFVHPHKSKYMLCNMFLHFFDLKNV